MFFITKLWELVLTKKTVFPYLFSCHKNMDNAFTVNFAFIHIVSDGFSRSARNEID